MNEKAPCGLDCCEICTNRGWEKWLLLVPVFSIKHPLGFAFGFPTEKYWGKTMGSAEDGQTSDT